MLCLGLASPTEGNAQPGRLLPLANARAVAFGARAVWATTGHLLVRINPARVAVVARIRLPGTPGAVAIDGRYVWVLTHPVVTGSGSSARSLLYSVDTATNRIFGKPVPLFPMAGGQIAVAAGSLWVTNDDHGQFGRLYRIDPKTRKLVGSIRIPNDPSSIVLAHGLLWVGESDTGKVIRVDPRTGGIEGQPIAVGGGLLTLAAYRDKLWVADSHSGRLVTINAATARIIAKRPLAGIGAVAASRGTVWTTFFHKGEVAALDATSGRRTRAPLRIRGAYGIETDGRLIWVTSPIGLTRINPQRGPQPTTSTVTLRGFFLQPSGILLGMHPSQARITIIATAGSPLKVCQSGTSFAGSWKGGCRSLTTRPLALPSAGNLHVGFHVLPANGQRTRVITLQLRWHCVDHYFALARGETQVDSPTPTFDC
ncbi:MAG: virginiamycin lyase [Gaiellales bacterium]|jgi:outer membrane protein assembly factor BamB|nr:virginiamycin lyase [Gaiellales bacterium]